MLGLYFYVLPYLFFSLWNEEHISSSNYKSLQTLQSPAALSHKTNIYYILDSQYPIVFWFPSSDCNERCHSSATAKLPLNSHTNTTVIYLVCLCCGKLINMWKNKLLCLKKVSEWIKWRVLRYLSHLNTRIKMSYCYCLKWPFLAAGGKSE